MARFRKRPEKFHFGALKLVHSTGTSIDFSDSLILHLKLNKCSRGCHLFKTHDLLKFDLLYGASCIYIYTTNL